MASSGMLRSAHHPAHAAAATNRKTRKRLRAENSMIVLIMFRSYARGGFQLAFGIDEKVAGGHDALAGLEAAEDFDMALALGADLDGAGLEVAAAAIDEHQLFLAGVEHGRLRNHEPARAPCLDLDLTVHVRLQR